MQLTDIVNNLANILDKEAEVYGQLLSISDDKTKIIVASKALELEELVKTEQDYMAKIVKLENERESLVNDAAELLKIDSKDLNITELVTMLPEDVGAKLKDSSKNISEILNSLKHKNELNGKLIKNALEYINFSINLLSGSNVSVSNYENTGDINGQKSKSMFDVKL